MKICTVCKLEKSLDEFKKTKTRLYARCRDCTNEYARKYHHEHKAACNEYRKELYKKNREHFLTKQKERYQLNKEEIRKRANARNKTPEERAKANARSRKWAKENRQRHYQNLKRHRDRHPEKRMATQYVMWGLRLGVLKKPDVCERCKMNIKLEGHHTDYSKPLQVMWLCRKCHLKEHNKLVDDDNHSTS